ncbi:MAG: ATP-binding cassette domain-containing protein [Frankiales bacterium]|nr:MAG: ATP-binding cassette domain-containing protein [Frankiales bacterium]
MSSPAAFSATVPRARGESALALSGVTRRFAGHPVWAPLDLSLQPGTVSVVTGENGSGKTTLLRLAAGLLQSTTGTRTCSGTALYLRAGGGLRSAQTVGDAVATTAALVGRRGASGPALALLGIAAHADRRLGTLSAGERVRATLAVAAAVEPTVLCLDEPTGVLDERGVDLLVTVLGYLRSAGTAVLVATHQPAALLPLADAHLRLAGGRLEVV